MSAGIFTDLKDNLLQLREIQRHADKPYSQHVRDVKGQQSQRQRLSAPHETAQLPKAKEAASSQSILSRSSSFVSVKNGNDAELEALKKRYASTVRLLAESLEEQSNLRAVMELTTNPGEIDSILQHDEFRLAALGPGLGGAGASEAEEASFLLRSIKIRSIVMEKERLLEEVGRGVSVALANCPLIAAGTDDRLAHAAGAGEGEACGGRGATHRDADAVSGKSFASWPRRRPLTSAAVDRRRSETSSPRRRRLSSCRGNTRSPSTDRAC